MTKPKATVLEIEKFNQEPEDKYYAKIKFKDPDTGEQLIGEFKLYRWYVPPKDLIKELEEAGEYPLRNIEGYW